MNDEERDALLMLIPRIDERQDGLIKRLYGEEQDKGDIPEIKSQQKSINGRVRKTEVSIARHKAILGVLGIGGGGTGLWALVQKIFNGG